MQLLDSLDRIRSAVRGVYSLQNLDEWICKYTMLGGKPYSFKNHEFQIPILRDTAQTSITVKCAQVGLSELSYRWAVAACCVVDDFTVIYTFPSSSDAEKNGRTRIDPMIANSPELARLVNQEMNNSEVKQFGRESFIFFKGTRSATQALSTPADCIIHDEWDKSDTTQASVYVSRLQHKPHKLRKLFSTPTVEKFGISKEAETAKRMKHLATCLHCNHVFLPDYFHHVKVPGWDKPLEEITKQNIHQIRWKEAELLCPKCGRNPDLHHTRMEYVCENPSENHEANAWYVSPFSAHNIITPSYLVKVSTEFERYSEFKNQSLGITAEEKDEAILASDIEAATVRADLNSSEFHVMGSDMGHLCHICIGRTSADGTFIIVHRESVSFTQFEERTAKLSAQYRVVLHVMDNQPYTDLVYRLSRSRQNNWGAEFATAKNSPLYTLRQAEESPKEGKVTHKIVKVGRTIALDGLLAVIKSGKWAIQSSEVDAEYTQHMLSMKRVQEFTNAGELAYFWKKSDGVDHYHLATLYLYIATLMRGTVGGLGAASVGVPLVSRSRGPRYDVHG